MGTFLALLERLGLLGVAKRAYLGLMGPYWWVTGHGHLSFLDVWLAGIGFLLLPLRAWMPLSTSKAWGSLAASRARALRCRGQKAAALALLTAAARTWPEDSRILAELSLVLAHDGRPHEAEQLARRALRLSPTSTAAGLNLAYALCRQHRSKDASDVIRSMRADLPSFGRRNEDQLTVSPGHTPPIVDIAFQKRNVAMLHIGRCGSKALGELLGTHSEMTWDGEIYTITRNIWVEHANPIAFLQSRLRRCHTPCYGFEFRLRQQAEVAMPIPAFIDVAWALGIRSFVLLKRRNLLRRIISGDIAVATKTWHTRSARGARPQCVEIDVSGRRKGLSLVERLEQMESDIIDAERALNGIEHVALTYESDVEDGPQVGYRKICQAVRLTPLPIEGSLRRTNPHPISHLVSNFKDVEVALRDTRFEPMLHE